MILANVVCNEPEILQFMVSVRTILLLIKIILPLGIILTASIDVLKSVSGGNNDDIQKKIKMIPKRLLAAGVAFMIPVVIDLSMGFVDNTFEYAACFTNATPSYVETAFKNKAEELLVEAEAKVERNYLDKAQTAINKLKDDGLKAAMIERAKAVLSQIETKEKEKYLANFQGPILSLREDAYQTDNKGNTTVSGSGKLDFNGYYTDGNVAASSPGGTNSSEPNPAAAINYWINKSSLYNKGDFIYPKASNGQSLGAWPKDYAKIPTQLTGYKTYGGGAFIFPNTPYKSEVMSNEGVYNFVYEHNGIDIIAPIGIPIYSPVDGELVYSEWGHTRNKGTVETSYSVQIKLPSSVSVGGSQIYSVFLTHMSGIVNRCARGECNKQVKKGELVGFVGWANAGHLHMTMCTSTSCTAGITTAKIEALYNIPSKTSSYNIKAGG